MIIKTITMEDVKNCFDGGAKGKGYWCKKITFHELSQTYDVITDFDEISSLDTMALEWLGLRVQSVEGKKGNYKVSICAIEYPKSELTASTECMGERK